MNPIEKFITFVIRLILKIVCKVEIDKPESIPLEGPLLFVFNHINFLEVPLIYLLLQPRNVVAMVKKENWDNWFYRILSNAWGGIPVDREKPKVSTFREIEKAIKDKSIICIAPEGTRSETGVLGKGHLGTVFLALHYQIPILPMAHYGSEKFWYNLKRFKRTPVTFKIGTPFMLKGNSKIGKNIQQEMNEQIMTRIASMLPEPYRGAYKNLDIISEKYIKYLPEPH